MPITYLDDAPAAGKVTYLDPEKPALPKEPEFKDLSAGQQLTLAPDVGKLPPAMPTTQGVPRVPVASYAETMVGAESDISESPFRAAIPRASLSEPRVQLHTEEITPEQGVVSAALAEGYNMAKSLPEFATSDAGILTALGGKLSPRLVAAGFSADMLHGAYGQAKDTIENWDKLAPSMKAKAIVDILGSLAMGGMLAHHATKPGPDLPRATAGKELLGPDTSGSMLAVPKGAPIPKGEPPTAPETVSAAESLRQAQAMTREATASGVESLPKSPRPTVPEGPTEPPAETAATAPTAPAGPVTFDDFVADLKKRGKAGMTIPQVQALYPQFFEGGRNREGARNLLNAAFPETAKPKSQEPNIPLKTIGYIIREGSRKPKWLAYSERGEGPPPRNGTMGTYADHLKAVREWEEGEKSKKSLELNQDFNRRVEAVKTQDELDAIEAEVHKAHEEGRLTDWNHTTAMLEVNRVRKLLPGKPEAPQPPEIPSDPIDAIPTPKAGEIVNHPDHGAVQVIDVGDKHVRFQIMQHGTAQGKTRTVPLRTWKEDMSVAAKPAAANEPLPGEKLTHAAWQNEGQTHKGPNHPAILKAVLGNVPEQFKTRESRNTPAFGFWTTAGRFVNRELGGRIAEKSGQKLEEFDDGQAHSDQVNMANAKPYTIGSGKPGGAEVEVVNDVVEADDLAKMILGQVGKDQTRQRTGNLASEEQIAQIAANPDLRYLFDYPDSMHGAPTIDDVVLAGNGRAQGLLRMYNAAGEAAAKYRAEVLKRAEQLGLGNKPKDMKNPVFVRRVVKHTKGSRRDFVVESNPRNAVLQETEVEGALGDHEAIGDFSTLEFAENGNLTANSARQVAEKLKAARRPVTQTSTGQLDLTELNKRVQRAALAKMAADNNFPFEHLRALLENDVGKRLVGAVVGHSTKLVGLDADLAIGSPLLHALRSVQGGITAVNDKHFATLDEWYSNRKQELGLEAPLTPEAEIIQEMMVKGVNKPTILKAFLDEYTRLAKAEQDQRRAAASGGDLFGQPRQPTGAEPLLARARGDEPPPSAPPAAPPGPGQGPAGPAGGAPTPAGGAEPPPINLNPTEKARAEEIKARLKKKLGGGGAAKPDVEGETVLEDVAREDAGPDHGLDPEFFHLGNELATLYLKGGVRKFGEFADRMMAELGPDAKNYLLSWYGSARVALKGIAHELDSEAEAERIWNERYGEAKPPEQPGVRPGVRIARKELIPEPTAHVNFDTFAAKHGFKLDEHQVRGINLMLDRFINSPNAAFLLADGTGFGKTAQMLGLLDQYIKKGLGKRVLIVTQNKQIAEGRFKVDAAKMGIPTSSFHIATYSTLDMVPKEWDLIIFDEAHNLKNAEAQKSIRAAHLESNHKVFGTATPMDKETGAAYFLAGITGKDENEVAKELGYQLKEKTDPISQKSYYVPLLLPGFNWQKVQANIMANRDAAIRAGAMVRREYPFFGDVNSHNLSMDFETKSEHDRVAAHFDKLIAQAASPRTRMLYSGQKSITMGRWAEQAKIPHAIKQALEHIKKGGQVVIVADTDKAQSFPAMVRDGVRKTKLDKYGRPKEVWVVDGALTQLEKLLKEEGITDIAHIHDTKKYDVQTEVKKFQEGRAKVALATPQSGGTGIDLDDVVGNKPRLMIALSKNFAGDQFEQLVGRVSRKNTKSPSEVRFLNLIGSYGDERRDDVLAKKIATLRAIQGGEELDTAVGFSAGAKDVEFELGDEAREHSDLEEPPRQDEVVSLPSMISTDPGMPPGVRVRGKEFAAELMEASRRLGALIRSKVNLKPGVMGQFVRRRAGIAVDDKIEVRNVNNQRTATHEMGHNTDILLWPAVNFADSMESLTKRIGTGYGTKKDLFLELKSVSELMRGPFVGSPGHIKYRQRASELIADFFSLYAHDPDKARAMAPKWTKGFEDSLARSPDIKAVVDELHAGNVKPVAPDALVPGTGAPAGMPGRVERQPAPTVPREIRAAETGEEMVQHAIRLVQSKLQELRIKAEGWRRQVPSASDRNDVGAFIEGIGNLEKQGDTIADVRARMTPEKEALAKQYRFHQEAQRNELNQYLNWFGDPEYLKFLENYLGHFYVNGRKSISGAVARWKKNSPHAQQRKIPTLREAVELGLTPVTQDPTRLYEMTGRINWRVAASRAYLERLRNLTDSSGNPVIVPASKAPPGWVKTQHPLVAMTYARPTKSGTPVLWQGGAAIHPDVWRSARMILEDPGSSGFWKAYDAINSFTRANAFAFSFFHDLSLRFASTGAGFVGSKGLKYANPLRGMLRLFEKNPITGEREALRSTRAVGREMLMNEEAVTDAALHGLRFAHTDSDTYQKQAVTALDNIAARLRGVPVLGKSASTLARLHEMRMEGLWRNTHDAYKIIAYHDIVSKALENAPSGIDPSLVKDRVASLLNDAFGGQEWETKFWLSPDARRMAGRLLLAPDWTLSTLRSVPGVSDVMSASRSQAGRLTGRGPGPAGYEGVQGSRLRTKFWAGELAAIGLTTAALQYAIYQMFGDKKKGDKEWLWDNEFDNKRRVDITPLMRQLPWHANDKTRYYMNLGKRPEEVLRWFTHADTQIESKFARPVAEIVKQVSGMESAQFKAPWEREHMSFPETIPLRAASVGKEFIPFAFSGNQFVLSAPYRKGMNKFKAQQAYESLFELQADPGLFSKARAQLRGVPPPDPTKSLANVSQEITEAAKANGVNTKQVMETARSVVRSEHYRKYFMAYQANNRAAMERESEALHRLGATSTDISKSMDRRKHNE